MTMHDMPDDIRRAAAPPPASESLDAPFGPRPTSRRKVVTWTLVVILIIASVAAVYLAAGGGEGPATAAHDHTPAASSDAPQPVMLDGDVPRRIGVTYATAEHGALSREVRTVGQVTFDETRVRTIAPKVDGWVERLYADFTGQHVAKGAPLFALYSPALVATQEELLLARRLERDVADGTADARGSAAELVASARRRLLYWDVPESEIARIERAGTAQRTVTLLAPAGGFIVEKNVSEGQRIMAGEPLYRVAELGTVWIEGEVFEQDLPSIRLGQRATAVLEAFPGQEFGGRISYVYPTLDPETRTARIRVELPNAGYRLKPGMYATLRIEGAASHALTVPRSAVMTTGERSLVFVRRADGMLEPREVATGLTTDDRIEIVRGLSPGETVVASATFLVDAESNLGTLMGGMGDMPGMDMTAPAAPAPDGRTSRPASGDSRPADPHAGHEE